MAQKLFEVRRFAGAAIGLAGLIAAIGFARASDPSVLWKIVHDRCVANMKAKGLPAPCAAVNLAGGYAVLKDIRGDMQFLVIPTERISGIDDSHLLAPASPNYWEDAWKARHFIEKKVGRSLPRDDFALAVNSRYARSQNQLHIHVDCVRPSVQQALKANENRIGPSWAKLNFDLAGHRYRAMRIEQKHLGALDPFKLLADDNPEARAHMGEETLVAIGMSFPDGKPGFVLLDDQVDLATLDRASGEELLDHGCKVLAKRQG
ncbi:MAG TPA: CDP-diacylglycerol diphosphatase [Beijerinckiaceae bacterium]|nr:CDP-diacylglycerol diphosphatase [Beijerinckiaceae bacterium]